MMRMKQILRVVAVILLVAAAIFLFIPRQKPEPASNNQTPTVITNPTKQDIKKADAIIKVGTTVVIPGQKIQPGTTAVIPGTTNIKDKDGNTIGSTGNSTTVSTGDTGDVTVTTDTPPIVINVQHDNSLLRAEILATEHIDLGVAYCVKDWDLKYIQPEFDGVLTAHNIGPQISFKLGVFYIGMSKTYDFDNNKWDTGYSLGLKLALKNL
jgi:hypothetical protein